MATELTRRVPPRITRGQGAATLRRDAFDAGLMATAAACLYALTLVLLRANGTRQAGGAAVCVVMLSALMAVRHGPVAVRARLRRRPKAISGAVGALLGVGLAFAGTGASLLFLPAVLLLATVGTVVPVGVVALAATLAAAGQLSVLALDDPAAGAARLALAAGLGIATIPVVLAALLARFAGALPPAAVAPPAPAAPPPAAALAAALLTPRQREVVALTRTGLRHGEIAQRLGVSVQQVRRLLRQARERTGTSTTRELMAWSVAAGLPAPITENLSETQARLCDD